MRTPLLILPGRNNSGPQHWQTLWQERTPGALRIDPKRWTDPEVDDWMAALDRGLAACTAPPILVAHSMGCLLSVFWGVQQQLKHSIAGAFLVAPPNFKREDLSMSSFSKTPESRVPFPALVVASTNDPYCPFEVAAGLAHAWGAGFVSVGARGHISTEPGNGDWPEGRSLLQAFAAGLGAEI